MSHEKQGLKKNKHSPGNANILKEDKLEKQRSNSIQVIDNTF